MYFDSANSKHEIKERGRPGPVEGA